MHNDVGTCTEIIPRTIRCKNVRARSNVTAIIADTFRIEEEEDSDRRRLYLQGTLLQSKVTIGLDTSTRPRVVKACTRLKLSNDITVFTERVA